MFKESIEEPAAGGVSSLWRDLPLAIPVPPAAFFAEVLEEIGYGMLVLGSAGDIVFANQLAQQELGTGKFVAQQQGKLIAPSAANAGKLGAALASSCGGQRALVKLTVGGAELVLSIIPLVQNGRVPAPAGADHNVLIVVGKREGSGTVNLRHYGVLHHLTVAEQALLPHIFGGLTIEDMAQGHHISTNTVRAHLKSIRLKTGARSLRILMARLAALPPMCSAFDRLAAH